jgi:SNF2 family DNA or RNA helicase
MSWDGELLTGEVVAKKRQAMVDRFQSGLSPLFVCTYGAGGVGITLTAACTVILVDRPWTPGDVSQAGKSALVLFYKVIFGEFIWPSFAFI